MSTKHDDGGSIFPQAAQNDHLHHTEQFVPASSGLSRRDYFAAAALQGIIAAMANDDIFQAVCQKAKESAVDPHVGLAISAYEYADAMIAESRRRV